MADIVAADVTGTVLYRNLVGRIQGNQNPLIDVGVKLVIDPGTTDAYPTGGIPLTNLFTAGTAQDTGIDVINPIMSMGEIVVRKTGALTVLTKGTFNNGGTTAATQTLVLANGPGVLATITGTTLAVASATSITDSGNGLVTAGFKVGDYVVCDGFTGTAGNNGLVVRVTVVAAGALTVAASGLTADAAGETVTISTIFRPVAVASEYTNTDVTLVGGPTGAADTTMTAYMVLRGRLRPNTSFGDLNF